jgi:hypothetical protein
LRLLKIRKKKVSAIFQNYADYRFFRLYTSNQEVHWVPGSGGTFRESSPDTRKVAIVQRDNKLPTVSRSINSFISTTRTLSEFKVSPLNFSLIGCSRDISFSLNDIDKFDNVGRRSQSLLFENEGSFLQPEGYGEGVPHTLVDAICSGLNVFIKKRDYIRYGLYKFGIRFKPLPDGWGTLLYTKDQRSHLSLKSVNKMYCSLIEEWLKR